MFAGHINVLGCPYVAFGQACPTDLMCHIWPRRCPFKTPGLDAIKKIYS